jgi:hypothetical protein
VQTGPDDVEREPTTASSNKKVKGTASQKIFEAQERERKNRLDGLREWQEEYCGSCKMEQEMLFKGRKHLSFG